MGEWVEGRLEDICEIIDGDRGVNYPSQSDFFVDGYCLFLNTGNVTKNGFNFEKNSFITQEKDEILRKGRLQLDDIILTTRGTVGNVALLKKSTPYQNARINSGMVILRTKKDVSAEFLYFALKSSVLQKNIELYSSGSAQPQLPIKDMRRMKMSFPSFPTQTRITDILSTYDDAIENNNSRIVLLEKAAKELYKEWFVRMRFPGHESTRIVNGFPEGWEVKRLNEFCHVTDGTHDTPKQTDYGVPLVTGKHIRNGFIDFKGAYLISEADHEAISRRSGLESGDILLSNIGTVGNICVVNYDREFSVKNVIILKPKSEIKTTYLHYLMTSQAVQDILSVQTNGASQQFVGLTFMRRFKILVPSQVVLDSFAKQIMPILTRKQTLYAQSQNLAQQRDLLLPRLMSGKLEV